MERNSYSSSNTIDLDDYSTSSYSSMVYLYSLGILPYSFNCGQKILSSSTSILQDFLPTFSSSSRYTGKNSSSSAAIAVHGLPNDESPTFHDETEDDDAINMNDVTMLMTGLGLPPSSTSDTDHSSTTNPTKIGRRELSRIFDEREPSLDEVKAAFDVFDQNRDGFIDAEELGRVLCVLGWREGNDVEGCRVMINAVDEDGDGRIGFNEFLMFMQKRFC